LTFAQTFAPTVFFEPLNAAAALTSTVHVDVPETK